jgi:predicted DCC family thiol-disulfide oxidoreductase YuxK
MVQSEVMSRSLPDGLMVFDGVCNFCTGSVRTILRMDRRGVIWFVSAQSDFGRSLLQDQGLDPDDPSSFIFFDRGRALTRSTAILAMTRRMGWPWRALSVFGLLPRAFRDFVYDRIARNRYRILGRRDACYIPTADERARFLDAPPQVLEAR